MLSLLSKSSGIAHFQRAEADKFFLPGSRGFLAVFSCFKSAYPMLAPHSSNLFSVKKMAQGTQPLGHISARAEETGKQPWDSLANSRATSSSAPISYECQQSFLFSLPPSFGADKLKTSNHLLCTLIKFILFPQSPRRPLWKSAQLNQKEDRKEFSIFS